MSTAILDAKMSDGNVVLLTEKTKSESQIFQFWYEGVETPGPSEHGGKQTGAKIKITIGLDEERSFVPIRKENIRSFINQDFRESEFDTDFNIHPDSNSGLMRLSVPKGVYVKFTLAPGYVSEGTITAINLVNEEAGVSPEAVA